MLRLLFVSLQKKIAKCAKIRSSPLEFPDVNVRHSMKKHNHEHKNVDRSVTGIQKFEIKKSECFFEFNIFFTNFRSYHKSAVYQSFMLSRFL